MTSTSPQDTSPHPKIPGPNSHTLADYAQTQGLSIHWRTTQVGNAAYSYEKRSILIDPALTEAETRSLLAHELAHHHYRDNGPQPPHIEARAWRWAARLLLTDADYATAERLHDGSIPAMAEELGVTAEIIHAYRQHLERTVA